MQPNYYKAETVFTRLVQHWQTQPSWVTTMLQCMYMVALMIWIDFFDCYIRKDDNLSNPEI